MNPQTNLSESSVLYTFDDNNKRHIAIFLSLNLSVNITTKS
jgi:hypothetical protein